MLASTFAYNIFNLFLLLGSVQGFITTILLFRFKPTRHANTLLAWLTLLISLACLNIYLLETVHSFSPFWSVLASIVPLIIIMPIGPLAYFYVKTILFPGFQIDKKNRPHFYSTIIDLIPYIASALLLVGGYFGFINEQGNIVWENFIGAYFMYSDVPRWISLSIYLWLTFKMIRRYDATKKEQNILRWAKKFTLGFSIFAIIWLFHLAVYLIPSLSDKLLSAVGWYPIYMPLIVLIYWIGINGFIISLKMGRTTHKLEPKTIKEVMITLENAMEKEKLYLNRALKLNDVVNRTEIPQKTVSAVLNQHIQKTFNEFINGYRTEEFKSRLLKENPEKLTIMGLAYECGFNSQATFQRVFKKTTGLTPKEFQQKHSKNRIK